MSSRIQPPLAYGLGGNSQIPGEAAVEVPKISVFPSVSKVVAKSSFEGALDSLAVLAAGVPQKSG
jgi:hypothetical protein